MYNSSIYFILITLLYVLISNINACDVMGSRACGERPTKEDQESDPVKYCVVSRVYFECVHKKYRGCENKEKYDIKKQSFKSDIYSLSKSFELILKSCKINISQKIKELFEEMRNEEIDKRPNIEECIEKLKKIIYKINFKKKMSHIEKYFVFVFRRSQEIADNVSDEFEHISRGGSLSSMTTGSFSSSGLHQV